jgi:hypothetical protein
LPSCFSEEAELKLEGSFDDDDIEVSTQAKAQPDNLPIDARRAPVSVADSPVEHSLVGP